MSHFLGLFNKCRIYPGSLHFIQDVSKSHPELGYGVFGLDFSADGRHLYVVDATTDRIFQFSTGNWSIEQVYSLGVDVGLSSTGYYSASFGDRVIVRVSAPVDFPLTLPGAPETARVSATGSAVVDPQ